MEKECKECGYPLLKGNEKFCPECGCKTLQNQSNDNGDNEAEDSHTVEVDSTPENQQVPQNLKEYAEPSSKKPWWAAFSIKAEDIGDNEAEDINYNGDNEAEDILRKALDYFRILIIFLAYISSGIIFIGSISISCNSYYYDTGYYWIIGLFVAVLNIIIWRWLAKLIWAVGMVFVNISTNIRIIKKNVATSK